MRNFEYRGVATPPFKIQNSKFKMAFLAICFVSSLFAITPRDLFSSQSGVRALGMGGAFIALSDDDSAAHWNPAGLSRLRTSQISSGYANRYDELNTMAVNAVFRMDQEQLWGLPESVVGVHFIRESVDNILLTGADAQDFGVIQGAYSDTKWGLAGTLAQRFNDTWAWGTTVKYLNHSHYVTSAAGVGVDVGLLWEWQTRCTWGMTLKNFLSSSFRWDTGTTETMSPALLTGLAMKLPLRETDEWRIAVDWQSTDSRVRVGTEVEWGQRFTVRAGIAPTGLTAGLGFRMGDYGWDYAYLTHPELGNRHEFSLHLDFRPPAMEFPAIGFPQIPFPPGVNPMGEGLEPVDPISTTDNVPIGAGSKPGTREGVAPAPTGATAATPALTLDSPRVVVAATLGLRGSVDYAKKLWINGRSVAFRPDGKFYEKFSLTKGANRIHFKMEGESGKIVEMDRVIFREETWD
jgi:hypothetical protein